MKTKEEIQAMLDESVNELLGQHRGRVDIVSLESHPDTDTIRVASVKMSGGCQGCAGAKATLRSIVTNYISNFDSTIVDVIDVTNHDAGVNPFFKRGLDD